MTHTPGPWEEDLSADGEHMAKMIADNPDWGAVATVSEDHGHVAYCHYSNARLIAAAPELLAALRSAVDLIADYSGNEASDLSFFRDIIAKAEGRGE